MPRNAWSRLSLVLLAGCAAHAAPPAPSPAAPSPAAAAPPAACSLAQAAIRRDADARAAPWSIDQHLAKHFPDGRVSWLMRDGDYQKYVVATGAARWGRCNDAGCYLFAAPAEVIHAAVERSMTDGHHDPAALGAALGLPAKNFEGPLRLMTLDLDDAGACARLPVDDDPGVWKCKDAADTDCFKFGGYTSGGVPEVMVLDAPIAPTAIDVVP